MLFFDVHTHNIPRVNTMSEDQIKYILNTYPENFMADNELYPDVFFSCGIHPWYCDNWGDRFDKLKIIANDPKVLAIGETGLDKLKGPDLKTQRDVFERQIILAQEVRKPMLIHCVKAWDELISLRKAYMKEYPWILHGFRGGLQQAKQLINLGFYLSLGRNLNREVLQNVSLDHIFFETDDSACSIVQIYEYASDILHMDIVEFTQIIECNIRHIFFN